MGIKEISSHHFSLPADSNWMQKNYSASSKQQHGINKFDEKTRL